MPAIFTPLTPIQYVPFDFKGYIKSFEKLFGHLSFFSTWKQYWLDIFTEYDEQVKDYIKKFPKSNPVFQRMKFNPIKDYEIFQFEHVTDYGTFSYHFDVEAMKTLKEKRNISIEKVALSDLYIDSDTPYIKSKISDQRLPFFVRLFGVEKPYICVDGNKRIKAKMESGITKFKGYIFEPQHIENIFFGPLDVFYYTFHYEIEFMYRQLLETSDDKKIFKITQLYLQANV